MAIKISLQSTKIPVEIGELKFEIDINDEKYEQFVQEFNRFLSEIESLDEDKIEDLEQLKSMVKDIYERLLGEGSYTAVYNEMPNIAMVSSVFVHIVEQLKQEMDDRMKPTSKLKSVPKKPTKKQGKK